MVRGLFEEGEFFEIFVDTPLEVAELRDPKGLYKKTRLGVIHNFMGIGSPYQAPLTPEFHIKTTELSVEQAVDQILRILDFTYCDLPNC